MTKTASTEGLTKALQDKTPAATNTGVDPYRKAQAYLKSMMPALTEALPKSKGLDAERLARITLTTLRTNPKLLECSIESLLGACLQAAQLGLDPSVGNCFFIPYKNQVSFQIGYKGLIDLVCRSGHVLSIVAQPVHKGDEFHYEFGRNETLKHVPAPQSKRGEVEYYYAYAVLANGGFVFQVMHISDIQKIRDDYSVSYKFDKNGSIWAKNFDSMALKSVIKRLIKYLPIQVDEVIKADETIRKDISAEAFTIDLEQPEIEILDKAEAN